MPARNRKERNVRQPSPQEKHEFLVILDSGLIKEMKLAAIERDVTASSVVEQAVKQWLKRMRSGGHKKGNRPSVSQRKQFLATVQIKLIKQLKVSAIHGNVTASSLVEEAVRQWLECNRGQA
jgi:hypothetical protein